MARPEPTVVFSDPMFRAGFDTPTDHACTEDGEYLHRIWGSTFLYCPRCGKDYYIIE